MTVDGVGTPRRLRAGYWDGAAGAYWAWPVDGYWDLHHVAVGEHGPDGSDVIAEGYSTLEEARAAAREFHLSEPAVLLRALAGR